jgi:hypothetical protein
VDWAVAAADILRTAVKAFAPEVVTRDRQGDDDKSAPVLSWQRPS